MQRNMNVFNYEDVAKKYDKYYTTVRGQRIDQIEKDLINELIKNVPEKSMLELGCGTGHWTEFFVSKGFEVTAIDVSLEMLKIAKNKQIKAQFLSADAEKLPFMDGSFSVIASVTMLEFVKNIDMVFDEIYRVLKPNGWLIIGALNAESILGQNKNNDEIFRNAHFMTRSEFENRLMLFGKPELNYGLYLNDRFEMATHKNNMKYEPVFMTGIVKKTI